MQGMLEFYFRDTNVKVVYSHVDDTDILANRLVEIHGGDALFHGFHDRYRFDAYKNAFSSYYHARGRSSEQDVHFVRIFYEAYGIPYISRVNGFCVSRDPELEHRVQTNFRDRYGSEYVLCHAGTGDRRVSMPEFSQTKTVNLDGIADNPFEMLAVLENARELHLTDSLWASLCYLLDAKYRLFQNIPVFLYPFAERSGGCCRNRDIMKLEPIDLPNWSICK
jgi:hypothetical protein